jgi:hypothetical protein
MALVLGIQFLLFNYCNSNQNVLVFKSSDLFRKPTPSIHQSSKPLSTLAIAQLQKGYVHIAGCAGVRPVPVENTPGEEASLSMFRRMRRFGPVLPNVSMFCPVMSKVEKNG